MEVIDIYELIIARRRTELRRAANEALSRGEFKEAEQLLSRLAALDKKHGHGPKHDPKPPLATGTVGPEDHPARKSWRFGCLCTGPCMFCDESDGD